ncbi:disease resistance protein RPV1-like [Cryptomeria japonica]|uniref:disease resistance protein RPV1-like n=1 Tax=Cryptomeria japonica TaxID=3369 RepID=UPI0027DA1C93|nr:disease resistance protein RPV1-like [Cryptomeria japonica]
MVPELMQCRSPPRVYVVHLKERFEAQLVKKVVNDIIKTLDRVPLEVAKYPVGLETVKKAVIQKLHLDSAQTVIKVGIWGIGGIGKTTVAKAVYNEVYGSFNATSFVFNVRSTSLTKLQGQILKDLINYEKEPPCVEEGKFLLRHRLRGIRILVILDDVDDRVQLDALAGLWLSRGSRLIITSRDKHILNAAQISLEYIFQISGLQKTEGLQLFCWHAFLKPSPIPSYEDLSKRIVEACKGHPLSLEVIGAFLYGKQNDTDIECWKETLDNIAINRDIFKTLKISYSGLSAEEREIFLDVACFFIGEGTTNPILFWKFMYKNVHTTITNLSMKLLIKIDEKGVFDMHDLVRDMGRIIAEKGKTRQWQMTQSSSLVDIVSNINKSGLHLYKCYPGWRKMLCTPSLRYLHLEHVQIEDNMESFHANLRWLRVDSCSISSTKHSSNLFKEANLALKKKCTSVVRSKSQLRILDITDCSSLEKLPDTIGNLTELQSLKLCRFQMLTRIPNTIANLSQLLYLNLTYCENLSYLPETIGNLSQLQYLNLTYCKNLSHLPDTIGNLLQLHIGKLSQLKQLSLSWCERLQSLPESISNLSKLERLDLLSCSSAWKSIPFAFLIQPKLTLLGLPLRLEERRRFLTENQDQIMQRIARDSSQVFGKFMARFREIADNESRK